MRNIVVWSIGVIVAIVLVFVTGMADLGYTKFFGPKKANIKRQIFEETKSYVHGKTQDLARYYEQYQRSESPEDKEVIKSIVQVQFANFDSSDVPNERLKMFLTQMRGY